jgi:FkbM family methyltransferase
MRSVWQRITAHDRPIRHLLARCLWASRLCTLLTISYRGLRLRFHPTSLSAVLWANPDVQRDDDAFFAAYLRPGDTVVDVGSNIGTLTLNAARGVGPRGRVYSFEPHPRTFSFLVDNLKLNHADNVIAHNVALGQTSGQTHLTDKQQDDQNTVVSPEQGICVPMRTLDEILVDEQRIQLLKIDVEGYERFVLLGAEKALDRTDVVYWEAWEPHFSRFGYRRADLMQWFEDHGFRTFCFAEKSVLRTVGQDYRQERCENLVSVREPANLLERTGYQLSKSA